MVEVVPPAGVHLTPASHSRLPLRSTRVTAPTPSPSPDTEVEEADMEEEDDEVLEEEEDEEEEEEEEVDEEEAEEEEEEGEAIAVKDPEEYEYPIDSGPYQTSDYPDSFDYERSSKATTPAPVMKGESCECASFLPLWLEVRFWPSDTGKIRAFFPSNLVDFHVNIYEC